MQARLQGMILMIFCNSTIALFNCSVTSGYGCGYFDILSLVVSVQG